MSRHTGSSVAEYLPFPRLYHCQVPRQEYLEVLEGTKTGFADLYLGFDSFRALYVSVDVLGRIVIHGEGIANDKARLKQAECIDFVWDVDGQSQFVAHLNQMTHLTSGRRLKGRMERLRVLSVQWGDQGLEYSFYVHDEASMEWNFVQQSQPYVVSVSATQPVDVDNDDEGEADAQDANLLRLAYMSGYFENPRRASLVDLGARAGLSSNTVNRRLRRIIAELVRKKVDP